MKRLFDSRGDVPDRVLGVLCLGRCWACGKLSYPARRLARRAAKVSHPGDPMRAYRCPESGFWHIGHSNWRRRTW